jgi:hypothetical protein
MQRNKHGDPARRGFLKFAATVPGIAAALPFLLRASDAVAQKMSKEAAKYQPNPKDGQRCDNCQFWIPPEGDGPGGCKVVEGDIAPEAWCVLYAPKG